MIRKMRRDRMRKKVGNRDLSEYWKSYQKAKYGKMYAEYCVFTQKRKAVN